MKMTNRSLLKMLIVCLLLSLVAAVFAFYFKTQTLDNKFTVGEPKVYLGEKFDPSDKWVPGEKKEKEVSFGNTGDMDCYLRAKFTPTLTLKGATEPVDDEDIPDGFKLNFASDFTSKWTKGSDGWYYYNTVLAAGAKTPVALESVTISDKIGNDVHGIKTDYSGSTFSVVIDSEFIQASQAGDTSLSTDWTVKPWE